jgi:uncharacterized protein YrrD
MLRSLKGMEGHTVEATDGTIGHVREFYFDDARWGIRYLVVDTGTWLSGRKVLIAPQSFQTPDWESKLFPVALTREKIRSSPDIDTDKPVARQHEEALNRHYSWDVYWAGEAMIANPDIPVTVRKETVDANKDGRPFDPHLRTTRIVAGLHVEATDGRIGHVEDFLADDQTWMIERLVVDAGTWLHGRKVQISPDLVTSIRIEERILSVRATRQQIQDMPPLQT